jgi:hypothetical protein
MPYPATTRNDSNENDVAVQDAAQGLSLLWDPPTNKKGDEDNNKNTSGDHVQYDKKNAHSRKIDLMMDDIEKKLSKEGYKKQWGEKHGYHSSGTSNEDKGGKKQAGEHVQKEDEGVNEDEVED